MESTSKLEQLLTEERTARLQAEENAEIVQKNSDDKIQQVKLSILLHSYIKSY